MKNLKEEIRDQVFEQTCVKIEYLVSDKTFKYLYRNITFRVGAYCDYSDETFVCLWSEFWSELKANAYNNF